MRRCSQWIDESFETGIPNLTNFLRQRTVALLAQTRFRIASRLDRREDAFPRRSIGTESAAFFSLLFSVIFLFTFDADSPGRDAQFQLTVRIASSSHKTLRSVSAYDACAPDILYNDAYMMAYETRQTAGRHAGDQIMWHFTRYLVINSIIALLMPDRD